MKIAAIPAVTLRIATVRAGSGARKKPLATASSLPVGIPPVCGSPLRVQVAIEAPRLLPVALFRIQGQNLPVADAYCLALRFVKPTSK